MISTYFNNRIHKAILYAKPIVMSISSVELIRMMLKYTDLNGLEEYRIESCRHVENIDIAFFGRDEFNNEGVNIPNHVVIMGKMRRSEMEGNTDVNTNPGYEEKLGYRFEIEELCMQNNVPCIFIPSDNLDEGSIKLIEGSSFPINGNEEIDFQLPIN